MFSGEKFHERPLDWSGDGRFIAVSKTRDGGSAGSDIWIHHADPSAPPFPFARRSIVEKWFVRMRRCGAAVRELVHDGCPVVCVEDAPFGYVNAFRSHVNVGFFHGSMLDDPAGLLEGTGQRMRHVKVRPGREPDEDALADLIDAAYADIKARLRAAR